MNKSKVSLSAQEWQDMFMLVELIKLEVFMETMAYN